MKKNRILFDHKCIGLICLVSALFVLICSTTTTPLMGIPVGGDSAMFQTIGKYWAQGVRPYSGLWDSKGPLIFLINALGYLITGSKMGVFILQCCNMVITALLVYRMLRIRFFEGKALLSTIIFLVGISLVYQIGNTVEEYCLPLLMLSFTMLYRWNCDWCKGKSVMHPPYAAFVYGLCFSVCFLTRITNAVGLCAAILVIVIVLLIKKNVRNLLENALAFIGGATLGILPFVLYFAAYGELDEMWYGTIAYNLEYAGASGLKWNSLTDALEGILGLSITIFAMSIGALLIAGSEHGRCAGIMWFVSTMAMLVYLVNTNGYLHYALVAAPFFPIMLLIIDEYYVQERARVKSTALRGICVMSCIVMVICGAWGMRGRLGEYYYAYYRLPMGLEIEPNDMAVALCKQIPKDERESFIAYNCKSGLYLHMDVCPKYRFFTMQDWAANCSTTLKPKILETYQQGDAKWILMVTGSDEDVYEIIRSRYTLVDQVQVPYSKEYYQLFRLNE